MTAPTFTQTDAPGAPYSRSPIDVEVLTRVRGGLPTTPSLTRDGNAFTPIDVSSVTWRLGYEPEALAVFAAFTTPPSTTRKWHINTLVRALKAAGVWDRLDLVYAIAAADSQAAHINLKAPGSYTLAPVNSPTFTADRGYAGNGTTSYLNTGWTPAPSGVKYLQNDASLWVWSRTDVSNNNSVIGAFDGPVGNIVTRHPTNGLFSHLNAANGTNLAAAMANGSGFSGSQRTSSTAVELFKNGVSVATGSKTSNGRPSTAVWIGGANPAHFSTQQVALAAAGGSLTPPQALAFYNAVLTYLQAVGAA